MPITGQGTFLFGVNDKGKVVGIKVPKQMCLDIENKINDHIQPLVDYSLDIDSKNSVVILNVKQGVHKPYLYYSS